ncbi:MAG TPA: PAS domain S-box protein [Xenococcaceae cyanobacterium]
MCIAQYIETNPIIVAPDTVISDAVALMSQEQQQSRSSCVLVVAAAQLRGILTNSDVVRLVATGVNLATTPISEVMSQPVISLERSPIPNLQTVYQFLQQHSISYLPILGDHQELLGVISQKSLVQSLKLEANFNLQHQTTTELERFFDINPTMLCIAGLDGYFRRINPAFSEILGFTQQELLAEPFINFVHPEDRAATIAEVASLTTGKTTIAFENRYRTKDGNYRWLLWTAKPYLQEAMLYATARDITEGKQAEQALTESEARWQLALKGANDGIWDWNVKTNQVFFSRRWKEMLGFSEAEIGNNLEEWSKRVHPDDIGWVTQVIQDHFAQKTPFYTSEHRVLCKDGSYKWILDRGQALWDEAGNVIRMTGSHTDISDRKQAEMQLKQERDFSNAVVNTVGALVAVLDRQGTIVSFNHTCEQLTGYTVAEIRGKPIWEILIAPEEKDLVKAVFEQLVSGQIPDHDENYWIAKDGSRHLISWSNTTLLDEQGAVEFIIATGIDITEQRQVWHRLEQQYRETKLLTEITRKIRMSIELDEILQTAVTEVQRLLGCDRVLIMKILPNRTALPISEAILPEFPSMLGYELADPLLVGHHLASYHQGKYLAIDHVANALINRDIKQLLQEFQIKAKLVVPILSQNRLKGLLVTHQCYQARKWQESEIQLLTQLADQIGLALSQAQLLNHLEELVSERTIELTASNQLLQAEIRERQQTEAKLQASQALLAKAEKIAKIGSWEYNLETQQLSWSEELFAILGFSPQHFIPPSCPAIIERIHPEDRLLVTNTLRQGHTHGIPWQFNYRWVLPHGTIKYLETRGEPTIDSQGKLLKVWGTIVDISQRIQAEKSLQRSEEQLQLITDSLPVLIAYIDNQQRYRYNNRAYETWFGKPRSSLLGIPVKELVGETNYQKMLPYIETALAGQTVTFEIQITNQLGVTSWLDTTYIPDFDSHREVKGFFSMVNNITDRKAIEQMKSEFISIASHEMRTPLTSIHGVIKLLGAGRLGKLSPAGTEMANLALRNSDRLIRFLNDILDLERIESGKDKLQKQLCNSAELINQAVATLRPMAQENQIIIKTQAQSLEISVDRDRLLQTLTNLLSNGIKFSPASSKILVTCQLQDNAVLFTIKDRGRGIPADQRETIFERFQQVDASDSRQKGGTGLGLAISRHIVEQHGGKIWVESVYGQGSTFCFTIPIEP